MNVYLNAVSARFAKHLGQRTSNMLGQPLCFPYFNAFKESLLSLEQLYHYIDQEIDRTLQRAGWDKSELKNIPILLGSTAYVISDCEMRVANHQPLPDEHSLAVISDDLRIRYQTEVFSIATSCTSSAQAIGYAYKMMKASMYEKVLVVGFEMFNRLTFEHFQSMNLLSQADKYQPFANPTGIILGEGVGCIALSTQPNLTFSCEIFGITTITDNENLTNSSKTALRELLTDCLTKTNLKIENIQGIKVHGVGGNSDEMEQSVLQELFPNTETILVKPYMGHTLGASGALETAFLIEHLQKTDVKCGHFLNYFLGFGGSNIAWILKVGE
ncbi:beta-ketoacyl synthase N-terminal-like domain-containing protein [Haemophilus parainfluenzae]|uniref:beta-ketoacyl synthase N-terminal-like domain-containing protein n=1 Tax=Haemophilus parainfluenzae TaxID=729 RepID=UPI000E234CC6|nr:beta-ketoacyl synthase N-terminal-like domain-containing protein [Haemophilus parainfluenzae]